MGKKTALKAVKAEPSSPSPVQNKLDAAIWELNTAFAERTDEIRGLFVSWLAGLHLLLLGPPGTAKSLLAECFAQVVAGGSLFRWLLTKFSTPEELFGPVSFSGLKADRFERVTTGKLPEAKVAFLDEIFKANSSILNSLLTALNEGLFFNGSRVVQVPLDICIGASNEYPEDPSLDALYDRFGCKYWVAYVADRDELSRLLTGTFKAPTIRFTEAERDELRAAVCAVPFGQAEADVLLDIKAAVEAEGFCPSDRTWIQVRKLVKAMAVLAGRDKIIPADFRILADALWREHKDRARLVEVIGNASDPYGSRAQSIIDEAKTLLRDLPDLSVLKSGQKTKFAIIDEAGKISTKLTALSKRVSEVADEAGDDNDSVRKASEFIAQSIVKADDVCRDALDHEEV